MSSSSSSSINPTCPPNSTFKACDYGSRFLGCCLSTITTATVCTKGCPPASIQPASFARQSYTRVTDGQCADPRGKWYTCADTDPPFFGCCNVNPCEKGCPLGGLVAAVLSENQAQKEAYAPLMQQGMVVDDNGGKRASSSSAETAAEVTTTATTSVAAMSTSASSAAATSVAAESSSPGTSVLIGGVVGGVVGGIIISAILAALIIFWRRSRLGKGSSRKTQDDLNNASTTHLTPMYTSQANRSYHELSPSHNDSLKHELPSAPIPVRELASVEVPAPVYELPSPMPSPGLNVRTRPSNSTLGRENNAEEQGGVSPMAGPYTPDTPGAKSEVSVLEVGMGRER